MSVTCTKCGGQHLPQDCTASAATKRKRGRPPTGFDKKAHDLEYSRRRRAALRAKRDAISGNVERR